MAGVEPDVRIFQDPEALSHAAASLFVETANLATSERGRCLVSLSGGKTPERLYALLAAVPYRELIDWTHLHAFWGDERCVPVEDLNNNYRQARELLLAHVPVPPENIHRVRTELDPELAAEDYALILKRNAEPPLAWPRFDMALLGLGYDGHTASLFPDSALESGSPVLVVKAPGDDRPTWRVSLTSSVFNSSRRVVFLVQGASKAKIVASVLYGESTPGQLPAQRIRPENGALIWMLDTGAAANR